MIIMSKGFRILNRAGVSQRRIIRGTYLSINLDSIQRLKEIHLQRGLGGKHCPCVKGRALK